MSEQYSEFVSEGVLIGKGKRMGQVGGRFVHATFVLVVKMPVHVTVPRTESFESLYVITFTS